MRDEGLKLAIEVAGGIGALARGLGIRQPSVSGWSRIPADRVAEIERLTGVDRRLLRPDLFASVRDMTMAQDHSQPATVVEDEVELARAFHYLLLARLLRTAPTAAALKQISALKGDGSPLGMARLALAEAAGRTTENAAGAEFFSLFIGIGRGEVLPYGSFYQTGFLHERPLARLREDLERLGIERSEGNYDPEDNLGLLLEVMGGFANGTFAGDIAEQRAFFEAHIAPWALRCLADVEASPSSSFYRDVARLGREFLSIEAEAFALDE